MNSRQKGCRGEREWRDQLREAGFEARRGQQFSGGSDSPDVVCPCLPSIHFEVKRVEAGNPYVWMRQAIRDAEEKVPVVAHKRNHSEWLCIMRAEDFLALVRNSDWVKTATNTPTHEPTHSTPSVGT